MNPASYITSNIVEYCKPLKLIFVLGATKTGKVTIAKKLAEELNRPLLISDEFVEKYGHDDALNEFENTVKYYHYDGNPVIVEGILCFRLLRKLVREGFINPDLIIKTKCNDQTISYFYEKDGEGHKIIRALGFNKGLDKIWEEYITILSSKPNKPKFLELNTSIF